MQVIQCCYLTWEIIYINYIYNYIYNFNQKCHILFISDTEAINPVEVKILPDTLHISLSDDALTSHFKFLLDSTFTLTSKTPNLIFYPCSYCSYNAFPKSLTHNTNTIPTRTSLRVYVQNLGGEEQYAGRCIHMGCLGGQY